MDKLIELTQVTAGYDRKIVLKDVSLTVWEHDFLGIIGPNGGGKTTLLKVILGLLPLKAGDIRFYHQGKPVMLTVWNSRRTAREISNSFQERSSKHLSRHYLNKSVKRRE